MAKRNLVERWLELAREARVEADKMRNPESKRTLLEIAESYEQIARRDDPSGSEDDDTAN